MSDRRDKEREPARDRRSFPRPPLWLNLTLIVVAIGLILYARHERRTINQRYSQLLTRNAEAPSEINRIRAELASLDVNEQRLRSELEGRMGVVERLKSKDFYLALDTSKSKLLFHYGNDIIREIDMQIGAPKTLTGSSKTYTFVPLKGSFTVVDKKVGLSWRIPPWVYLLNGAPVPSDPPSVENGLGKYVIFLPNDYVIHSPPSADSPLKGAKPASFMVPEADLIALWPRINAGSKVFIF
ncbi:MAG TPA: L,D-transpeptidase [Thermoanaerobaculia bacterium]|nr:L,D-transpeptidase [Thermoanaerobaculia bacterium]